MSRKLGDNVYSPIVRDSLSWLHRGYELRIIDESLRGIAVGHTKWDLTPDSVMTHGWVDDLEERVISIKYGPTEEEETDVEVPRDIPVTHMSPGDTSLVKPGAGVVVGAQPNAKGDPAAVFIFVGKDGHSRRFDLPVYKEVSMESPVFLVLAAVSYQPGLLLARPGRAPPGQEPAVKLERIPGSTVKRITSPRRRRSAWASRPAR